jgi:hypothetical protein
MLGEYYHRPAVKIGFFWGEMGDFDRLSISSAVLCLKPDNRNPDDCKNRSIDVMF